MSQTTRVDPYQLSTDAVVEPPSSFGKIIGQIGPGLILTASIVGTGELIATTNLGAEAGFALLWLVLLSCFVKVFVQVELGRYAISSGDTTLASFHRVPYMGSVLSWWWFLMMLCTQFQIGAMIGGTARCVHMALPGATNWMIDLIPPTASEVANYLKQNPEFPWMIIITPLTIILLVAGRYHVVERVCTILVAAFTLLTVLCMLMLPWANLTVEEAGNAASVVGLCTAPLGQGPLIGTTALVAGTPELTPASEDTSSVWLAAFAMIGITGVGAAELIAYPYWCLEKRYARYIGPREQTESWARRALGWMKVMNTDAWLSMVIYTLATIAFYVLGAAVLFKHTAGHGLTGDTGTMLRELAKMYEPVLGYEGSIWFIAIGGFVVLYSTLFAATAGNSRVTTDFLRVQQMIPFEPEKYRIAWIRFFSAGLPLLGLLLYLTVGNPVHMVVFGGVAQALTLPMIGAVAIFLRMKRTDPRLVRKGLWDGFLWLSLGMFTIAAAYGIWSQIQRFLN